MAAPAPSTVQPSGRIARLVSLLVLIAVIVLAVYFLIRGAWWVSALLIVLGIAFEGGLMGARKRKRAASRHTDAAI